jgi:hypothetical protein
MQNAKLQESLSSPKVFPFFSFPIFLRVPVSLVPVNSCPGFPRSEQTKEKRENERPTEYPSAFQLPRTRPPDDYLAYSTMRVSRMIVTLILPG